MRAELTCFKRLYHNRQTFFFWLIVWRIFFEFSESTSVDWLNCWLFAVFSEIALSFKIKTEIEITFTDWSLKMNFSEIFFLTIQSVVSIVRKKYIFFLTISVTIKIFFFRISISFLWNIIEKFFLFKTEIDNKFASKSNTYNTFVIATDWFFKSILISSISWVFRTSPLIIVIVLLIVCLWVKIDSSEIICLLTFKFMIHFRNESTRLSMIIQISSKSFFFSVLF